MTVARLALLQLLLVAGFGSAYLVPTHGESQPAGVNMNLPESIGEWTGEPQAIGDREREELAADTTFARKLYSNAFGDHILVSIVLAGEDPDNSLHRPERCLPAQGWTVLDSSTRVIKAPQLPGGELKVTRLHSERKVQDEKGALHTIYNVNDYWFVGYRELTPSPIQRALIDIRDRVASGVNQRWAYVTVASVITEGLTRFGRSEKGTDEMLQSFVSQIFPRIVNPVLIHAPSSK
ncbi:MAG: EpsI family protein [Chthoniobacterales bacterium]|nr:MAG: EpsI family protein [Chthoniobacterales bacterium]